MILRWGHFASAPAPTDSIACVTYRLSPPIAQLELHRHPVPDPSSIPLRPFTVAILISATAATELVAGDSSAGAQALRLFAAGAPTSFRHRLSPRARLALESIQRCPFVGACRHMALTARCHDLLVEFLSAWTTHLISAPPLDSIDRLRLAAEILTSDLDRPPRLAELAAQAGLSETTLKRSFPQAFGTTVFGYLRQRRMTVARALIESGQATILEAATQVGYCNPSNFAAAFRREFGVNPKAHQLAARR